MSVIYEIDLIPGIESIIEIYENSGLKRPTADPERIAKMYAHADLVVTAWHQERLVGIARSITDFSYCCYLSDLAVRKDYQHRGIGKKLVELTKEKIGEEAMLLLLSVPTAMDYYPKIGMQKVDNGFIVQRAR